MYNRTERDYTYVLPTGTGRDIGPGLYKFIDLETSGSPNSNWTKAKRFANFFLKSQSPSWFLYDVKIPKTFKGCSTLRNTSARFRNLRNDVPGPGKYDAEDQFTRWGRLNRSVGGSQNGKLNTGIRHKYTERRAPDSIPRGGRITYFEKNGRMFPDSLTPVDCNLSPAYYTVRDEPNRCQRLYQGSKWGYWTRERVTCFEPRDGPGPAAYGVEHSRNPDKSLPFRADFLRFPGDIQKYQIKQGIPSPNALDVSPGFQTESQCSWDKLAAFDSTSQRFRYKFSDLPGPGHYSTCKDAYDDFPLLMGGFRKPGAPFGVNEIRFNSKPSIATEFNHDLSGSLAKDRKKERSARLKGGFNVKAPRNTIVKGSNKPDMLDPPSSIKLNKMPTAAFESTAQKACKTFIENTPCPTEYDVLKAFHVLYDQKDHRKGESSALENRKLDRNGYKQEDNRRVAFNVGSCRLEDHVDLDVPGPGLLDIRRGIRKQGTTMSQGPRLVDNVQQSPGPGDYEVAEDGALMGTFNISLDNPLLHTKPSYYRLRNRSPHRPRLSSAPTSRSPSCILMCKSATSP